MWWFVPVIPFDNENCNINACYTRTSFFRDHLTPTHETTERMGKFFMEDTHSYTLKYYKQQYLLQTTSEKTSEAPYPQVTIKWGYIYLFLNYFIFQICSLTSKNSFFASLSSSEYAHSVSN